MLSKGDQNVISNLVRTDIFISGFDTWSEINYLSEYSGYDRIITNKAVQVNTSDLLIIVSV